MDKVIHDIIQKHPQKTAIVFDGQSLSYQDIYYKSNYITEQILLKTNGVTYPIAFCLKRGFQAIIVIIGIIQAGCYYVPLDVSYPIDKIKSIIDDSNPFMIISDDTVELSYDTVRFDGSVSQMCTEDFVKSESSDKIAYQIYTSGSTGAPKGVMIKQSSVINLINSAIKYFKFDSSQRILHYTSVGFDAAGWDIYIALFSGSTIYVTTNEVSLNPPLCHQFILENGITMATVTPAFLSQMPLKPINSLKNLVVMGDLSDTKYMDWWSQHTLVYNGYGPTECTIGSTIRAYHIGDNPRNVGIPFDGYVIYILDDELKSTDEIGEICIGGKGVAVGYHNLENKTKEKFIMFNESDRIYRTGDLGRVVIDETGFNKTLEFLGRKDNQVKINGIRIELEEIESHIMSISQIERACCIFYNKQINTFYQSNELISFEKIRSYLKTRLHTSVVPVNYFHVSQFKLNHNGKIDRKLLHNQLDFDHISSIENTIIDAYAHALNIKSNMITSKSNFFELGGHSLILHKVLAHLQSHKINITVIQIMQFPIISELARQVDSSELSESEIITNVVSKDVILLSPLQMTLLKHKQINPTDASYNTVRLFSVKQSTDIVSNLVSKVIKLHPALLIKYDDMHQKINNTICIIIKVGLTKSQVMDDIKSMFEKPFDLNSEQLIRICIYSVDNESIISIIKDGSICDAYSENILTRNFIDIFSGKNPENEDNYVTAIVDLNNKFTCGAFWKDYLKNPFEERIPQMLTKKSSHIVKKFVIGLDFLATKLKTTSYVIVMTAMGLMLRQYFDGNNVIFGTQIALRNDPLYENTVGFFVSTLLFRINFNFPRLFETIQSIHQNYIDIYQNKYVEYDNLIKMWTQPVDVMFVYQNLEKIKGLNELEFKTNNTPFPITWYLYKEGSELVIDVKTFYDECMVNQMIQNFTDILYQISTAVIENENVLVSSLQCEPEREPESNKLIGEKMHLGNQSVDQYVDLICKMYSDRIAIQFSSEHANHLDKNMTYHELNKLVSKCANYLINIYDIRPGSRVIVALRKSINFVILLLAVLKTGACYIPIDPDYPNNRIRYMIHDSSPQLIITKYEYKIDFEHGCVIDSELLILEAKQGKKLKISKSTPDSLAYIVYTSGSTGNPKACMITHKAVYNVCRYFAGKLNLVPDDKVWSHTTISFDIMVLELFLPLFSGAKLLICPQCVTINPVEHVNWINSHKPTVIQATPTQFSIIARHIKNPERSLRILVGGEQLNTKLAETLLKLTKVVYNVYGPSETTIWSTISEVIDPQKLSIGYPIANTTCIVLNSMKIPVPMFVTGELYIGGIGLSLGYYNKPEITESKFVGLPSYLHNSQYTSSEVEYHGEKFYATGDLVKMTPTGLIYIGRNDFQVKIRGHRIELEEIIRIADSYEGIQRSCIRVFDDIEIGKNNGEKIIVLYVISLVAIFIPQIFEHLRSKLPKNHVPSFVIQLPRFPETLNGKIDTKILPNPFTNSLVRYTYQNHYIAPRNDTEKKIHELFCHVLGLTEISVTESLLNVGMSSIYVFPCIEKLKNEFGTRLTVEEIYQNSTIEKIAKYFEK